MTRARYWIASALATVPAAVLAESVPPAAGPVTAASAVPVVLGLALVLAFVAAAAWLIRRLQATSLAGAAALRVVGGVAVGQRERVILLEVDETWIVLGVAPGQVSALHQMPRPASAAATHHAVADASPFAARFRQMLAGGRHG